LSGLVNLRSLNLSGEHITDAGLEHLRGLALLETLNLKVTWPPGITDTGLFHLRHLVNLREVYLRGHDVTGHGLLDFMKALPKVKWIFDMVRHTGPFLGARGNGVSSLNLSRAPNISDRELELIRMLTDLDALKILDLSGTQISDIGLQHLTALKGLHTLNLCGTRITDSGLENLRHLTNLATLMIVGTSVTDEGVNKLKAALPKRPSCVTSSQRLKIGQRLRSGSWEVVSRSKKVRS
jgi:hypothetical protein